jgi:lipoprotein-anchoring transpeptidase ErfK/SrfK
MGSRLLAGCLALLLFLTLIGGGVLYFLQYQQKLAVDQSHTKAVELYFQTKRPKDAPLDPAKRAEAIQIWRNEVIPKGGRKPFVAEALYLAAQEIAEKEPDTARDYYQRIVSEFPQSDRHREATAKLAEFRIRTNPEEAKNLYSQVLDASGDNDLKGEATWGMIRLEDKGEQTLPPEIKERYQQIVIQYPKSQAASKARERLDAVNRYLIFQDTSPNELKKIHIISKGEVLMKVANQYETTVYIIEMLNGIVSKSMHLNQSILVPTWGKVYAVVDKSDYQLRIFREEDKHFLIQYKVGIGEKEWKTKTGEYIITNKQMHPPWPDPKTGKLLKYEDPDYPLGERWMGLSPPNNPASRTGLGIHGTNQPETIGTSSSAGCIRLKNEDVIEAFAILREKSRVIIQE